jgi:hypothetical protein
MIDKLDKKKRINKRILSSSLSKIPNAFSIAPNKYINIIKKSKFTKSSKKNLPIFFNNTSSSPF